MTNVLRKKPFIIALTKYAGGNSNQVGKTLILKKKIKKNTHLKTLKKKKTKEYIRRWKDLLCSGISRINIGKVATLQKTIYKSMKSSSKSQCIFYIS